MENERSLYDDICSELTNYETGEGQEMTDEERIDVFYNLLCRVQNAIDFGDLTFDSERHPPLHKDDSPSIL